MRLLYSTTDTHHTRVHCFFFFLSFLFFFFYVLPFFFLSAKMTIYLPEKDYEIPHIDLLTLLFGE